jgi:hypothetical protein
VLPEGAAVVLPVAWVLALLVELLLQPAAASAAIAATATAGVNFLTFKICFLSEERRIGPAGRLPGNHR